MGLLNRTKATHTDHHSSGSDASPIPNEKGARAAYDDDDPQHAQLDQMKDPSTRLHRGLKARQVTMIAIGGAM